ncbi:MAG: BrnT family toxin [Oscillibacter sp.]|nr:BrnT family toxin [Oscillibacter sp.]MBQ7681732.1 BrnT family toxin [Oscillibacter sp.]MBQ9617559.1 BrnT family toxin [Oscillibacter sp.]
MGKWNGLAFEWDEEKARLNYRKHHVRFETAAHVFEDKNRIERYDNKHSDEEERYQVIGKVGATLLLVIYTERGERIRLISARKADPDDRREYLLL